MKSGIYVISNCLNRKFYIGSSKDIDKRIMQHISRLIKGSHRNGHLQKAFDKYSAREIKEKYFPNISSKTIWNIMHNKRWKHLKEKL